MYDAALMQISYGINNWTDNIFGLFFGVDLFFHDFLVKLSPAEILEYEVDIFLVGIEVVELNDVRMLDVFHNVDFSFKQYFLLLVHFLSSC
jgi:hypothetical protein